MEDVQKPVTQQNQPLPPIGQKEVTTPYVFEGLIIGIVLASTVIGGMYYKTQLSAKVDLQTKLEKQAADRKAKELQADIEAQQAARTVTPQVVRPTEAPVIVQTQDDLISQKMNLDALDTTEITKGLEANSTDSTEFAL